jgi:hypothetical protein
LYTGSAEAITIGNDGSYNGYGWDSWLDVSNKENWPTGQDFFGCQKGRVAIPRVIRYLHYDKIPKATLKLSRHNIYKRDNYTCYLCGEEHGASSLTIDHIIPVSRGGKNTWENLITCCQKCNWDKGDKLLSEIGKKPLFLAHKPHVSNIQRIKLEFGRDYDEWKFFGV